MLKKQYDLGLRKSVRFVTSKELTLYRCCETNHLPDDNGWIGVFSSSIKMYLKTLTVQSLPPPTRDYGRPARDDLWNASTKILHRSWSISRVNLMNTHCSLIHFMDQAPYSKRRHWLAIKISMGQTVHKKQLKYDENIAWLQKTFPLLMLTLR